MGEVAKLSSVHVQIMDYMLANPVVNLGDVARHFHYTQAWLSQIIHSDAFQRQLKEKQEMLFHMTVLPIREKMEAIAHQALDRLSEQVTSTPTAKDTLAVAGAMLDRVGHAPATIAGNGPTTVVQVAIGSELLAKAREKIGQRALPSELEGHKDAKSLLSDSRTRVGGLSFLSSLPGGHVIIRGAEEGDQV